MFVLYTTLLQQQIRFKRNVMLPRLLKTFFYAKLQNIHTTCVGKMFPGSVFNLFYHILRYLLVATKA